MKQAFSLFLFLFLSALLCDFSLARAGNEEPDSWIGLDSRERMGLFVLGGRSNVLSYNFISYERFLPLYNEANKANLSSPLSAFQVKNSYCYGGGFRAYLKTGGVSIYYSGSGTEATASATTIQGDRREFRIETRVRDLDIDLLLPIGKRNWFWDRYGDADTAFCHVSGYRYANGFLSYGIDKAINGIFTAENNCLTGGVQLEISIIKQLRAFGRLDYIGLFEGRQKGGPGAGDYELLKYEDQLYGQSQAGGVHIEGDSHFYLPEDPAEANNEYIYFVGQGSAFAKSYKGWRLQFGIQLDLFTMSIE